MSRTLPTAGRVSSAAAMVAVVAGISGCTAAAQSAADPATPERTLTVFAASSLAATFAELATGFEAAHPGVQVHVNAAGSADLVAQAAAGAPADVLATADTITMAKAIDADLTDDQPEPFASNSMTIVTPANNPAAVTQLADLANPRVKTVLCAPQVPCGAAAARVELTSGVTIAPVSEETSAAAVLGKVTAGEADAGIVYATDARVAAAKVHEVPIPAAANTTNTYPIAVLKGATQPALAEEFLTLVRGAQGQAVLRRAGFGSA